MSDFVATPAFGIIAFILLSLAIVASIFSAIYFYKLKDPNCTVMNCVSTGTANTMFIINIAVAILLFLLWVWVVFRMIFPKHVREKAHRFLFTTKEERERLKEEKSPFKTIHRPVPFSGIGPAELE